MLGSYLVLSLVVKKDCKLVSRYPSWCLCYSSVTGKALQTAAVHSVLFQYYHPLRSIALRHSKSYLHLVGTAIRLAERGQNET